jgi:hypothetical protein
MANYSQLRGMLLEEAILFLLRASGYKTIESEVGDETLEGHPAGLAVKGRGGRHQIDAIADFLVSPPFSYPQRLLLEAKCYNKPIGLDVARNAFGVLQDVEEYWVPSLISAIPKKRYHYQYAIASINGFSKDAQEYAYAHDIYLLALERASYFQQISEAIYAFFDNNEDISLPRGRRWLYDLRMSIRESLRERENLTSNKFNELTNLLLNRFLTACRNVGTGIIAILNGRFPVILIPNPAIQLGNLDERDVRIYRGDENRGWLITTRNRLEQLFSFDIPQDMFEFYADGGDLTPKRALDLKAENMGTIQLIITVNERIRIITLRLDTDWIDRLREQIDEQRYPARRTAAHRGVSR